MEIIKAEKARELMVSDEERFTRRFSSNITKINENIAIAAKNNKTDIDIIQVIIKKEEDRKYFNWVVKQFKDLGYKINISNEKISAFTTFYSLSNPESRPELPFEILTLNIAW